jgi:hypothetical protein
MSFVFGAKFLRDVSSVSGSRDKKRVSELWDVLSVQDGFLRDVDECLRLEG